MKISSLNIEFPFFKICIFRFFCVFCVFQINVQILHSLGSVRWWWGVILVRS